MILTAYLLTYKKMELTVNFSPKKKQNNNYNNDE
jgi:hypothetical protein